MNITNKILVSRLCNELVNINNKDRDISTANGPKKKKKERNGYPSNQPNLNDYKSKCKLKTK